MESKYENLIRRINNIRCKYCHGSGLDREKMEKDIHRRIFICKFCKGTGIKYIAYTGKLLIELSEEIKE